ncbi:MAG: sugar ABC transporter substrate-binding protein [Ktedonobacteraceae bacterium]
MKLFGHSSRKLSLTACMLIVALFMVACGSANTGGGPTTSAKPGQGCKKIGVLLPETATSARWDNNDRPELQKQIPLALSGATVDYNNAEGDASTQLNQAEADLTKGDCILVVAPVDSTAAAQIVAKAKAATPSVPVIAYDRLIQSKDLAYYVSFDGVAVGKVQGQYIADHYQKYISAGHSNMVMINGAQTDNNALLFKQGAASVIDPLVSAGSLTKVYDQFTPKWDNPTAQNEMDGALSANSNNIQVAYVANDGMANSVIAALKAQQLNGKVLVTGQDATVAGIQNILTGDQTMTVEKNFLLEAQGTAQVVAAISNNTSTSALTNGAMTATSDSGNIPSILEQPVSIDASNFQQVVTDGLMTKADICKGLPANAKNLPAGYCS